MTPGCVARADAAVDRGHRRARSSVPLYARPGGLDGGRTDDDAPTASGRGRATAGSGRRPVSRLPHLARTARRRGRGRRRRTGSRGGAVGRARGRRRTCPIGSPVLAREVVGAPARQRRRRRSRPPRTRGGTRQGVSRRIRGSLPAVRTVLDPSPGARCEHPTVTDAKAPHTRRRPPRGAAFVRQTHNVRQRPMVEMGGIEPPSIAVIPRLLRAHPVQAFCSASTFATGT